MNIRRTILSSTFATLVLLFAACASNKINWDTRVGTYSYDQAITELGPPDKMAMLSDQTKVAEWFTQRRSGMSIGLGTGVGPIGAGVGVPVGGSRPRSLRLTFGQDGILKSWSR